MKLICRLPVILAERNISLKELKRRTGLNYSHLSDIKRGRKIPNLYTAYIIAKALNMNVEEIWIKK